MIDKSVDIPIFEGSLRVQVVDTQEDFESAVLDTGYTDDVTGAAAITLRYESHPKLMHLIFVKEDVNPGVIAHESLHATNRVLMCAGHKTDYLNDETQCYLLQFIVGCIHKIIEDGSKS